MLLMLVKMILNIGDMCEVVLVVKCGGVDGIVVINIVKFIINIDFN